MTADLEALARRVEAEEPSYDLWIEAAVLAQKYVGNDRWSARRQDRFHDFVTLGAYLDAADMIRPVGWATDASSAPSDGAAFRLYEQNGEGESEGFATGPAAEARARLAAALRARAQGGGDA